MALRAPPLGELCQPWLLVAVVALAVGLPALWLAEDGATMESSDPARQGPQARSEFLVGVESQGPPTSQPGPGLGIRAALVSGAVSGPRPERSVRVGSAGRRQSSGAGAAGGAPGKGLSGPGPGLKGPPDKPPLFQFRTLRDVPLSATIATPLGEPLPLARVAVLAALVPPPPGQTLEDVTSPDIFFDGFSDGLGQVAATLSIPASVVTVDVAVMLAGFEGDYTHEEFRTLWGPFAPSVRIAVPVGQLASLTLVLEDEG